jgi:hypothetical protein
MQASTDCSGAMTNKGNARRITAKRVNVIAHKL